MKPSHPGMETDIAISPCVYDLAETFISDRVEKYTEAQVWSLAEQLQHTIDEWEP